MHRRSSGNTCAVAFPDRREAESGITPELLGILLALVVVAGAVALLTMLG